MARPRPEPGTLSSSLSPRVPDLGPLLGRQARAVILHRQDQPARRLARSAPAPGAWPICSHCRSGCPASLPGPGARRGNRCRRRIPHRSRCRARHGCASSTRARSSSTGADLGAVAQHIERAGGAGAGEIMIHLAAHGDDLALDHARPAARGRIASCASASPASTDSGVLRKCARLETWVRARPTTSSLCWIRELSSVASGAISVGKLPSSRRASPSRMRASASLTRRSGSRPTRTCTRMAAIRPRPSSRNDQNRVVLNSARLAVHRRHVAGHQEGVIRRRCCCRASDPPAATARADAGFPAPRHGPRSARLCALH